MFLWSRDKDSLKTVAAVPTVAQLVTAAQGSGVCLSLVVSGDGMQVLLVAVTGLVFLWECVDVWDLARVRDSTARGPWAQIQHPEKHCSAIPKGQGGISTQHLHQGGRQLVISACQCLFSPRSWSYVSLSLRSNGRRASVSPVGNSVRWVTKTLHVLPHHTLLPSEVQGGTGPSLFP
ncbi:hypothetical protein J4Q44_G00068860 [Coregonus suidteri]|uniref:Uncharacterized protein n=1 Tax=Coregonus suidteri TaxID=861788 RepID=A0AAN8M426_9TELE